MVSKQVDIITKSWEEGSKAVKWSCDGSPAYEIDDAEREAHGSDIILYIDDDSKEFLEKFKLEGLLNKYCKFLPVPVAFGKKTEWKDGKQVDTEEDNIINNVEPLWTKAPSSLKDEDYKSFYRTLYPMHDEPLFWIHLNVDYPFNLTGILYFPRIKNSLELQKNKIQELLNKYCKFLAIPVAFGKKTEWKDGKQVETAEDNVINNTTPIWTKKPSELEDKDYINFYHELYPMADDPLFWIHLNVDYPFNLTGVLYFPKIKSNFDLQKNKIQLYCNQVYVTDSVEGIVPEFLTLLHGVIDSPDIPLNVSRSYLQSDANVKKISSYISKKVSDRLSSIFKNNRAEFEEKWDDIKIFIHYGMLSEDAFYDKASKFALFKDTEGKFFTYEDYATLVKGNQTDKNGDVVYLYSNNKDDQYSYIEAAKNKGYSVLLMDGQLDVALISMLERKLEKTHFTRVDGDVVDKLIVKDDNANNNLDFAKSSVLSSIFKSQMPKIEKTEFNIEAQGMGENATPVMITQSEYMRRMKEMANIQQGMAFYGEMPTMYNIVLNSDHALIKGILSDSEANTSAAISPIEAEITSLNDKRKSLEKAKEGKKDEEIPQADKDALADVTKKLDDERKKKEEVYANYAKGNQIVHQLIDLALLQNGMLKGEALNNFVKRSVELIK
ncbi:MAG: molecular chaperone HtpG [Bacteroidaceae bacterium]|nr:molecular chaperone HtpG [Bacteroidaceae bacterium]